MDKICTENLCFVLSFLLNTANPAHSLADTDISQIPEQIFMNKNTVLFLMKFTGQAKRSSTI